MATHFSTLAWKIPWTEKWCRLQSMGSQRVGHDWVTSLSLCNRSYLQHYLIYDMCTVLPLPKPKIWFCVRTYRLLFLCPLWRQENWGTKRLGNIHEVRARKCQGQDSVRAGWLQTLFPWPLCFPVSTLRFIAENKQLALFWWGETK